MKQLTLALLVTATALPSAFAWQNSQSSQSAHDKSLLARVTVYWARGGHGADRYSRQHKSATGARLHVGHCAVDPRRIPYGSQVVLPDGTKLAAVDTGSAVRNRKAARYSGRTQYEKSALVIDKFFETKREALAWANTNPPFVNVKVIPPNMAAVSNIAITNSKPIALTSPQGAKPAIGVGSVSAMTISRNAPAAAPTGGIIKNPLGRLGR
jgi:3D (Asp-Asp-Asp) domain-containing protein